MRAGTGRDREYLYIDGGCLRASIRALCKELFDDENAYQPCYQAFASGVDKVFYYDAVPGRNHEEAQAAYEARVQPDHDRFAKIQALNCFHVALGHIVGAKHRQKGVDVHLAVDMMTHAFRGNINRATLFAGDADFVPLIKALVSEGLHVTVWHPPQANADLKGAADSARLFRFRDLPTCLTADGVQPAFQPAGGGNNGMTPENEGVRSHMLGDRQYFAGRWKEETLRFWNSQDGRHWSYQEFRAPSADLARAVKVFEYLGGIATGTTRLDLIQVES